ncbi:MAG: CRISPR-associated helicase Cas3' [Vicinamibacterales bacterium]
MLAVAVEAELVEEIPVDRVDARGQRRDDRCCRANEQRPGPLARPAGVWGFLAPELILVKLARPKRPIEVGDSLQGTPDTFWGKLRREAGSDRVIEWHPLVDHCADVAAVAEALLGLPVWRDRLGRLAGQPLTDVSRARLCVIAALHDIGKLNIGFQAKGRPELGTPAGHVREALGALYNGEPVFACLSPLNAWGDATAGLLEAAICHHGRPYAEGDRCWQASWWMLRAGLNPRHGAERLFAYSRTWFASAFDSDVFALPDTPAFAHAFAGLVMLADWIGSDTRFFPFSEPLDADRIGPARVKAQNAISALALDVPLASRIDSLARTPFSRVAPRGYSPRPAQLAMLHLPLTEPGSVTILEAETGSGKTEAVLARFVTLFESGAVDGMYFALPTRSAATQMHGRIQQAVRRAFLTPPPVVLAVPGYLRVDDIEGQKLAPFEVLWADEDRFRFRGWAAESPKRYLAGCISVGTIDQVLLSSLMVGHAHLRAAALLRQLLVIDEVHASDAYMTRILESVLARHIQAGGHAILLSATLGGEARSQLLHPEKQVPPVAFGDAEAAPYPLITHRDEVERTVHVASDGAERIIELEVYPWLDEEDTMADAALLAGVAGAKVLVIRNTVTDCVKTQLALERAAHAAGAPGVLFACAGVPSPHHSRFSRADRQALDAALERQIGKQRSDGGCVVVATQTVQQSLDLDADILFSDLCPIDVLLQRLGRLHRHPTRPRPRDFDTPRAFVVTPRNRDLGVLIGKDGAAKNYHGLGRVYPDLRMLEAMWRMIEKEAGWRIPAMNRHLVESGLHSSVLDAIAQEGGADWQAHSNYVLGTVRGQRRHADLCLVDWSRPYTDVSFPSDPGERIMTRLGEGDRRVRFQVPAAGPFGLDFEELVLPAWWARGATVQDEHAEDVSTAHGVTHFTFGDRAFVYDRLGLRPHQTSKSELADDDGP